jgi:hypothetical protein
MNINAVRKGLDGCNDSGSKLARGYRRAIDGPIWTDDGSGNKWLRRVFIEAAHIYLDALLFVYNRSQKGDKHVLSDYGSSHEPFVRP